MSNDIALLPTSVHDLPGVSAALGIEICVKRDDLTGLALGGNKARKLQHLVRDARQHNADVLVTGGGVQSNHVRQTAAAAAQAGLDAHVVLGGATEADLATPSGNVLLDLLLGATITTIPTDRYGAIERAIDDVAEKLRADGRTPYAIPVGGASAVGVRAYVEAAAEFRGQRPDVDLVFLADGSGGTHAGLLTGFANDGPRVVGVDVGTRPELEVAIRAMCDGDVEIVVDHDHIGPGYGELDAATIDAIRLAARTDGLLLDPVYTGKAFAALVTWARREQIDADQKVCFWHTGGQPALFADKYRGEL